MDTVRGDLAKAVLLKSVVEADGDATLNLLDLIDRAETADALGPALVERLLQILELRIERAQAEIESRVTRDIVVGELDDATERLRQAVDLGRKQVQSWSSSRVERRLTPDQKVQRFYDHTINPRKGWLIDLGCITKSGRNEYRITRGGHRMLDAFRKHRTRTPCSFSRSRLVSKVYWVFLNQRRRTISTGAPRPVFLTNGTWKPS